MLSNVSSNTSGSSGISAPQKQIVVTSSVAGVAYVVPQGRTFVGLMYTSSTYVVINGTQVYSLSAYQEVTLISGTVVSIVSSGYISLLGVEQ